MSPLFKYKGKLLQKNGKLANNQKCCCSKCKDGVNSCTEFYSNQLNYIYNEATGFLGDFCTFVYIRGEQVITIPDEIPLPATVVLTGGVNDDLVVNGQVIQEGQFPFGGFPCNGAHDFEYCFVSNNRTFTIATKENYGFGMSADVTIRFCK